MKIGDRGDAGSSTPRLAEARGHDIERADVAAMPVQQDEAPAAVAEDRLGDVGHDREECLGTKGDGALERHVMRRVAIP